MICIFRKQKCRITCALYSDTITIYIIPQPHQAVPQIFHRRITGRDLGIAGMYEVFIALVIVEVFAGFGIVDGDADMGGF